MVKIIDHDFTIEQKVTDLLPGQIAKVIGKGGDHDKCFVIGTDHSLMHDSMKVYAINMETGKPIVDLGIIVLPYSLDAIIHILKTERTK